MKNTTKYYNVEVFKMIANNTSQISILLINYIILTANQE